MILKDDHIQKILEEYKDDLNNPDVQHELYGQLRSYFEEHAVLGLDIYRYSKYADLPQTLIPYLFTKLYEITINNLAEHESFLFQNLDRDTFKNNFVNDGDGGFQLFETPLHALIFAYYFQLNIQRYNSVALPYSNLTQLKEIVGEITLRYSLTYDIIFSYEGKYHGPALTNCARIISRDKLNRFLVDNKANDWFIENFNGIETLYAIDHDNILSSAFLKNYRIDKDKYSIILPLSSDGPSQDNNITNMISLKIGKVEPKGDIYSVYSLYSQASLISDTFSQAGIDKFVISIGNLNPSGLSDGS